MNLASHNNEVMVTTSVPTVTSASSTDQEPGQLKLTLEGIGSISRAAFAESFTRGSMQTSASKRDLSKLRKILSQAVPQAYHDDLFLRSGPIILEILSSDPILDSLSLDLKATDIIDEQRELVPYGYISLTNLESYMKGSESVCLAFRSRAAEQRKAVPRSEFSEGYRRTARHHGSCKADAIFLASLLSVSSEVNFNRLLKSVRESYVAGLKEAARTLTEKKKAWGEEEYEDRLSQNREKAFRHIKPFLSTSEKGSLWLHEKGIALASSVGSLGTSSYGRAGV